MNVIIEAQELRQSFTEIFACGEKILSFEFFPPKQDKNLHKTFALIGTLKKCRPHFMTVTYGAGGGTRDLTQRMVSYIHNTLRVSAVAHLTCVGHNLTEINAILDSLSRKGVNKVLALRGDPPQNSPVPWQSAFANAEQLTRHLKQYTHFSVAVAGYPETHRDACSPTADIEYLKRKVDAGAELIITQLFFDAGIYSRFLDRARAAGILVPILPGIMPIADISQVTRFTTMCGASIPNNLLSRLERFSSTPDDMKKFGIEYAISLCQDLLHAGAPGIHLYTLNKGDQIVPIVQALNIGRK